MHNPPQIPIKVGISACLLGQNVRYDGGHKHDHYITDTLGRYLEFVPVCPEVEAGFGIPRETLRLVGDPAAPRLMTTRSKKDMTETMTEWAKGRVRELARENLCGFIFKSRSPSSGMARVKVYRNSGQPSPTGVGLFARQFMDHFPLLPVEEEGRLHDPVLRENFIERLFAVQRWQTLIGNSKTRGKLVDFHTRHKLQLMAHSIDHYRQLGRLVAQAKELSTAELYDHYHKLFMAGLTLKATHRKNTNVLQHMMGYFKKQLTTDEKKELLEIIERYRTDLVPLIVPITLLNHYVRKFGQEYLAAQYYLQPHPLELSLRNSV